MRPSALYIVLFWCSALPVLVGAWRWRHLAREWRLIAVIPAWWITSSLLGLAWQAWVDRTNNLWVQYLWIAVDAVLVLWIVAGMQRTVWARNAVRFSIPAYHLAMLASLRWFESAREFSVISVPLFGVLATGLAMYTLLTRAFSDAPDALPARQAVTLGWIVLYYGMMGVTSAVLAYYQRHAAWLAMADTLVLRIWFQFAASLTATWLLLWPTPATSSGPSPSSAR